MAVGLVVGFLGAAGDCLLLGWLRSGQGVKEVLGVVLGLAVVTLAAAFLVVFTDGFCVVVVVVAGFLVVFGAGLLVVALGRTVVLGAGFFVVLGRTVVLGRAVAGLACVLTGLAAATTIDWATTLTFSGVSGFGLTVTGRLVVEAGRLVVDGVFVAETTGRLVVGLFPTETGRFVVGRLVVVGVFPTETGRLAVGLLPPEAGRLVVGLLATETGRFVVGFFVVELGVLLATAGLPGLVVVGLVGNFVLAMKGRAAAAAATGFLAGALVIAAGFLVVLGAGFAVVFGLVWEALAGLAAGFFSTATMAGLVWGFGAAGFFGLAVASCVFCHFVELVIARLFYSPSG